MRMRMSAVDGAHYLETEFADGELVSTKYQEATEESQIV